MQFPGWLYNLVLIALVASGQAITDALPQMPIAGEWWFPALIALLTGVLSWIQSARTMSARSADDGRWRRFWLG